MSTSRVKKSTRQTVPSSAATNKSPFSVRRDRTTLPDTRVVGMVCCRAHSRAAVCHAQPADGDALFSTLNESVFNTVIEPSEQHTTNARGLKMSPPGIVLVKFVAYFQKKGNVTHHRPRLARRAVQKEAILGVSIACNSCPFQS